MKTETKGRLDAQDNAIKRLQNKSDEAHEIRRELERLINLKGVELQAI